MALTGGHGGGANVLATRVGALLGAQPVITTASDATGSTGLDELVELLGARVDGDLAAAGTALLDGSAEVHNPLGFPLPPLPPGAAQPRHTIIITDRLAARVPGVPGSAAGRWNVDPSDGAVTRLVPPTLVVGIGSARGVPAAAITAALHRLESEHGLDLRAVRAYASVDLKADEAGILAAIAPAALHTHPAAVLARIAVPNPSEVVRAEVGTPSVAEAAALHTASELAGGAPVELVVEKMKGADVTVAAARIRPRGRLAVVGLGPGAADLRVPRADAELRRASIVVGLDQYVAQVAHLLRPGTEVRASGLGDEELRAADAVALAAKGHAVALIGSGDAGVYAMASPALQQAGADIEVVGVPGVTAALTAAVVARRAARARPRADLAVRPAHPVAGDRAPGGRRGGSRPGHLLLQSAQPGPALAARRRAGRVAGAPTAVDAGGRGSPGRPAGAAGVDRAAVGVRPDRGGHADHRRGRVERNPDGRRAHGHAARLPLDRHRRRGDVGIPRRSAGGPGGCSVVLSWHPDGRLSGGNRPRPGLCSRLRCVGTRCESGTVPPL